MVAVKIIEYTQEPGQKDLLEGLLSEQVHHPNVVSGAAEALGSGSPVWCSFKFLECRALTTRHAIPTKHLPSNACLLIPSPSNGLGVGGQAGSNRG
jgi:hypothetical protein